ncbi:MAG TPA: trigger factor [Spirochaetota bacterium]|nr:trigger factor [Spirochaetota bacterium]HRZ27394.1 trigger factor [Spirochaetota bacterium]HSA15116.1 trigger factor [Spirochaetota bacterium]
MNITDKKLDNASMELTIEVPADRVEIEYKAVYDKLKRTVAVDGFRKGKVPMQIVESRYAGYADQEVTENIIKSSFLDAVTEKQLTPIAEPHYDFEPVKRGQSFTFKAVFDTPPKIEIGKYREIPVDERACAIEDADIEKEIDAMRDQYAVVTKKEDQNAVVVKGDLVKIQMKRIDDVDKSVRDEVEYKEYPIIVGRVKQDSVLDDQIEGMKSGEEKEIEVKYPKEYYIKDLAGQKAKYMVKVSEINDRKLPELDDEFAKKVGYESMEDFRKKTREYMEKFVADKSSGEAKFEVIKQVIEGSTFEIPESMIIGEMYEVFRKTQQRFGDKSETIDAFCSAMGLNPEDFRAQLREEALYSIKKSLILFEIARKEELSVSDETFNEFVKSYSERTSIPAEEVEKIIEKNRSRESIENELLLNNSIDFLYSNAKVNKVKPVSFEEFINQNPLR